MNVFRKSLKHSPGQNILHPRESSNEAPLSGTVVIAPLPDEANSSHRAISQGHRDQNSSICLKFDTKLSRSFSILRLHEFQLRALKKTFRSHHSFASLKQTISPLQVSASSVSFCEMRAAIQL